MAAIDTGLPRLMLFVEPDGGWAVATGAGLNARGWTVAWAVDAVTAVPVARQTLPDVVVIDAELDEGAVEVLRWLRAVPATALIPAIALCADVGQESVLAAAGAQVCLRKPVDVDALDATVRAALELDLEPAGPPTEVLGDAGRLQLLEMSGLLDADDRTVFDAVTVLAAELFDVQSARVTLVSDTEQVFTSRTDRWSASGASAGTPVARPGRRSANGASAGTPLTHSLCQWPAACGEPLVVRDARVDPLLATNKAVTELDAVAYLGAPLTIDGYALGTLCVLECEAREWDPDDLALLEDLAAAAAAEIRLRLASAGAAEAGRAAADAVAALARVIGRHGPRLGAAGCETASALLAHFAGCLPEA